ncbi:malate dehydrogenase (quinone) [Mangrovicoccus algicola]|uniref:Probable malate:quinone oxidoreductase n=1 Tax=Mangrovicoccus algicola TaxID=2771008 RepID=A0A8J6YWR0_9RHOB|nr:malate dehydrogenase (quinone) [Mangrovicoccus algicola]MBE3637206.1 malate dehydrogenase (quinone) [Mangrovicoccus algicola]
MMNSPRHDTGPAPTPRRGLTRRRLLGSAMAAGAVSAVTPIRGMAQATSRRVDVLLIGGGIMSATLGVFLKELEPDWDIELIERLDSVAEESSNGWNNAGTGHSALCELNYTPETDTGDIDITKALAINEQWQITRQFLAHQVRRGVLENPRSFLNSTPHMSFVWGDENIEYLRKRFAALQKSPLFAGMEFSEDHDEIKAWTPLMMQGPNMQEKVAATWSPLGTDANWGEVTRQYAAHLDAMDGFATTTGREVTSLERMADGGWRVFHEPTGGGREEAVEAKFVFIGAGGAALPLLQDTGIPEAEAYAGFPVGGAFLICENPDVVGRHAVKAYGKAASGNPPMSVPHLDRRFLDGKETLLFGPFATFSTKFLKHGSLWDLPASMTVHNVFPMMQVGIHQFELVEYLAGQLMQSDEDRMEQLRAYVPDAKDGDWRFWKAGQRVQIIKNTEDGGQLKLGTEIVASADRSVAALLGASPGASTAAPIMLDLMRQVFPEKVAGAWAAKLREIVPSYGTKLNDDPDALEREWAQTAEALQLAIPSPRIDRSLIGGTGATGTAEHVPDIAL